MLIEIKNRFNGSVLFSHDCEENSLKITLEMAINASADLISADLSSADLSSADLRYADLSSADLLGEKITQLPLQFYGLVWDVLVTDGFMTIGCQRHTHEQWQNFTDDEIRAMDTGARLFWKSWKEPLLLICKNHAGKAKNEK